jgi:nucleotide-binding universal stress UspA family protein
MAKPISADQSKRYVVVAGVDFSEVSQEAMIEAGRIACLAERGELHVVHVVANALPPASIQGTMAPELTYLNEIDSAAAKLQSMVASLELGGVRLAGHIRVGPPDREIAQVASDVDAHLVVVGSHGHRGLARLLLGSVAESLVRRSPCAVLVHRARSAPAWELIERPCADCVAVQKQTHGTKLWCARHSEHHLRAHTYHEYPEPFGMGAQTFRS